MKLDSIFSSNMVFVANKPIRVYGTGRGSGQLRFAGLTKTVVSEDEKWCVEFPSMSYGGPYELVFCWENESICLTDIYIGEVYLFAGQSNVEFKMWESAAPDNLYRADERLRLFSTDKFDGTDRYSAKDGWIPCQKETIRDWSALGYLAGKELADSRDIAVGIIACYQGSSSITSWLPKGTYQRLGIQLAESEKHPGCFYETPLPWHYEESLYASSLAQVVPFSISAVVWYQGEGNTSPQESRFYLQALVEFIKICRHIFADSELPFVVVQLADYAARNDEGWRNVQLAQEQVQRILPYVKTVISSDVCENDDIHPKTKHLLAKRIAQALGKAIEISV